jgi:RNA polymerase sigma-70 factor, ECF subfamily
MTGLAIDIFIRIAKGRPNAYQRTTTVQDELELLARARRFERDALAQIHDAYYRPIFRYISFRVGNPDVAEDLASEVFTRFLGALRSRSAPSATLRGWLYGVAANIVADHHRTRYRAEHVELDEALASYEPGPAETAEAALIREDLRSAVAELTEEQQQCWPCASARICRSWRSRGRWGRPRARSNNSRRGRSPRWPVKCRQGGWTDGPTARNQADRLP